MENDTNKITKDMCMCPCRYTHSMSRPLFYHLYHHDAIIMRHLLMWPTAQSQADCR